MKVLFICNIPSPYRVAFFNELGRRVELTVLFERQSASDRDMAWVSDKFLYFKGIYLKGKRIGNEWSIGLDFKKYINRNTFEIIVIAGYSSPTCILAILYCQFHKISYIISSDGALLNADKWYKKLLKKMLIGKAEAALCTGETSKEYLNRYGLDYENIYIYPFTSLYSKDIISQLPSSDEKVRIREKLGITEKKVVLSIGQFIYRKGFDILLKSCKSLPNDVGIYIIGGEPTEEYLEYQVENHLDNVHFLCFKSKADLEQYYLSADVFVLPTREDIWGLVINEALAYGLPVITTDKCCAGLELVKDDFNGYVIPVDDNLELSNKLNLIINDSRKTRELGERSLKVIKDYTFENMANCHVEEFGCIMKKRK